MREPEPFELTAGKFTTLPAGYRIIYDPPEDEDAPPCPRCLRRIPATLRAAWASAGVGLALISSTLPVAACAAAHYGPAFLRTDPGPVTLYATTFMLIVASGGGAMACFAEARR